MKKGFIIGCAMLALGLAAFIAGFALSGGDIRAMEIETDYASIDFGALSETEYTYSAGDVKRVNIESVSGGVTVGYSDDALIHVISENGSVDFAPPANGVLTVRQNAASGGKLFNIDLNISSGDITVLVPYHVPLKLSFDVTTVSGGIDFELGHLTDESSVELRTTSGSIRFPSLKCGSVSLYSVSGSISGTLAGVEEDYSRDISTVSGNVSVRSGGSGERKLYASTVSGNISVDFAG